MKPYLQGYRLLIAEDNPTNQIVVARIVEQMGGSFDLASDGVEAIQIFDPSKYDLALLDIEMPKKSGLDVMRHIRDRSDTPKNFPIVALTAYVLSGHRAKIRDAGADAILPKPIVDIDEFGQVLAQALDGRNSGNLVEESLLGLEENMGAEVMPELLQSLVGDLQKLQGDLGTASNPEELSSVAHALKSLAQLAGARRLAEQSAELEASPAAYEDWDEIRKDLQKQMQNLLGEVEAFGARYK